MSRARLLHATAITRGTTTLPNILGGGPAPPVVVRQLTSNGLQLDDGLIIPGACIFLEGEVLLWDAPPAAGGGWNALSEADLKARFEVFETVVPRPGVYLGCPVFDPSVFAHILYRDLAAWHRRESRVTSSQYP
jgi:NADH dehydrogenase [ubiquinone] 1 alpha subcomplex assembly factor 3